MENLQDKYAPNSICFGCGPANEKGLKLKSIPLSATKTRSTFLPDSHHEAFPGMINGGIIGSILDCHSNWTAAWHLMNKLGLDHPPCTVTAYFNVKLLRPTPSGQELHLEANVDVSKDDRANITATVACNEKVTATCEGLFVAVKPGHPAYHRWH